MSLWGHSAPGSGSRTRPRSALSGPWEQGDLGGLGEAQLVLVTLPQKGGQSADLRPGIFWSSLRIKNVLTRVFASLLSALIDSVGLDDLKGLFQPR